VSAPKPSIGQLWNQAAGDGDRYRELMRQHGYILKPGDEGYEEGSRVLPCGWPRMSEGDLRCPECGTPLRDRSGIILWCPKCQLAFPQKDFLEDREP
jgi:hypothetical protein